MARWRCLGQMGAMLAKWLEMALTTAGRSQRELADAIGVDESVISKIINRKREIKATELIKIAAFLEVPLPTGEIRAATPVSVPVVAHAAAGVWRDRGAALMTETVTVPAVPAQRYRQMTQRAVKVDGADFARTVPPGSFVIFVPFDELRRPPMLGDVVYVERARGNLVEYSLRRVSFNHENVMELSSEPLNGNGSTIKHPNDNGDSVVVVGLCIGTFSLL